MQLSEWDVATWAGGVSFGRDESPVRAMTTTMAVTRGRARTTAGTTLELVSKNKWSAVSDLNFFLAVRVFFILSIHCILTSPLCE